MGEKIEEGSIFIDGVEYHGLSDCEIEPESSEPFVGVTKLVGEEATLTLNISTMPSVKEIRDYLRRYARRHPEERIRMKPRWRNKHRAFRMMEKPYDLF